MDDQTKKSIKEGWKQAGLWCLLLVFFFALGLPCLQIYGWLRFGRWAEAPASYVLRRPEILETRVAREQAATTRVWQTMSDKKPLDFEAAHDLVKAEQNLVRFVPSLQLAPGEEPHEWLGVRKIGSVLGEIHLSIWLIALCWFSFQGLTNESPEAERARRDREQKDAHARLHEQYLAQEAWEQKKAMMEAAEADTDHGVSRSRFEKLQDKLTPELMYDLIVSSSQVKNPDPKTAKELLFLRAASCSMVLQSSVFPFRGGFGKELSIMTIRKLVEDLNDHSGRIGAELFMDRVKTYLDALPKPIEWSTVPENGQSVGKAFSGVMGAHGDSQLQAMGDREFVCMMGLLFGLLDTENAYQS